MRIAQVAPLVDRVSAAAPTSAARSVFHLTEELVRQGHPVTLFASGDSETSAELVPVGVRALGRGPEAPDPSLPHALLLDRLTREARRFDLVHFHLDGDHLPLSRFLPGAHLTTIYGRLDSPEAIALWHRFPQAPVVATAEEQRASLPSAAWQATIPPAEPGEEGAGARLAREYLEIYRRLLARPAPYALGPVHVAMTPMAGAREPFLRWDSRILTPRPPTPRDGES